MGLVRCPRIGEVCRGLHVMRVDVVVAHPPKVAAVDHSHWAGYDVAIAIAHEVRRRGGFLELFWKMLICCHAQAKNVCLTVVIKLETRGSADVM
jgi:hypothetical protein